MRWRSGGISTSTTRSSSAFRCISSGWCAITPARSIGRTLWHLPAERATLHVPSDASSTVRRSVNKPTSRFRHCGPASYQACRAGPRRACRMHCACCSPVQALPLPQSEPNTPEPCAGGGAPPAAGPLTRRAAAQRRLQRRPRRPPARLPRPVGPRPPRVRPPCH